MIDDIIENRKNGKKHYNRIEKSVKNERIFYETSFERRRKSI